MSFPFLNERHLIVSKKNYVQLPRANFSLRPLLVPSLLYPIDLNPKQKLVIMSSSQREVLAVCRTFLSGIKARSPAQMRSVVLPGGHGTLIRPTPEGKREVLRLTMEGVIDRIPWHRTEIEFEETIAGAEWEGDDGMFSWLFFFRILTL